MRQKHFQTTLIGSGLVITGLLAITAVFNFMPQRPSPQGDTGKTPTLVEASRQAAKESLSPVTETTASPEATEPAQTPTAQQPSYSDQRTPAPTEATTFLAESGEVYPLRTYRPLFTPNDPGATQWWTTATGVPTAWSIGAGSRPTTIAVIDTGFGLAHEDLIDRWYTNSGEQGPASTEMPSKFNCTDQGKPLDQSCNLIDDNFDAIVDNESGLATLQNPSLLNCTYQGKTLEKSCNLVDDDNNGFVDDVRGWDFAHFDSSVQAGEVNPNGADAWHGTAVAGVMAATGNNGIGIAGVNWSSKILPLQAIDDDSYGNTLTVSKAIDYAVARNVDIISLSLGSEAEDSYVRQAVQRALDKDILVVAASGNQGCDCMIYPAHYPEVLAVGAQNTDGTPASFSSYGTELDIMAPGVAMATTTWTKDNGVSAYTPNAAGTSFSTPYISGLLGLARSHQPNATWGELTNALLASATHSGLSATNPFLPRIGYGYAQAGAFLTKTTTPATPNTRYTFGSTPIKGALSSALTYQCLLPGDYPTAPLYRIAQGSSVFYTIDSLEYVRALARGDTVRSLGRTCVGLPNDAPAVSRLIHLTSEIDNLPLNKALYQTP